ncbi:MAG: Tyrosine-specific transport protein [Chlamydiae bacterium]|nr:Tyrosine-specific transport protein [Chlamydiota bacterium]
MDSQQAEHKGSLISAIFLVAGTCVGGGMLVLPLATGISGFLPSIIVMAISWFAMTATGLLLIEISLWLEEGAHIITMTSRILGPIGKGVSWLLYLFICYASTVAYTAGGGVQISAALENFFHVPISKDLGCLIFILFFGTVIYFGSWFVGRINTILFTALVAAYFLLVGMGLDEVNMQLLYHRDWRSSFIAIPLLLTAFSFQTMVPSLTPYLKRNVKALRMTIVGGTSLAFVIYFVWQWIILGIVPVEGPDGLAVALAKGDQPATVFLRQHVNGVWISVIAEYFAFFAIVTSFLGIALGLFDFLSDGLKIKKEKWGSILLGLLIAIPTLIFATKFERAFMAAMDVSGGLGDSLLNGIIPVLMIWRGRYYMNFPNTFRVPGGRILLIALASFFVVSLTIEILGLLGITPIFYEAYDIMKIHNLEEVLTH